MVSVSVRKERYSYDIIRESGEFVVNLVNRGLVYGADYCGVKSGRDVDKFKELGLTALPLPHVKAPGIGESPVCLECKVTRQIPLGTHDMFLAEVLGVSVDGQFLDKKIRQKEIVEECMDGYSAAGCCNPSNIRTMQEEKQAVNDAGKTS